MNKIGLLLFLIASFLVFVTSCVNDEYVEKEGYIIYTGTYDTGGCEFVVQFPNIAFQPQNLEVQHELDSLHVLVRYERLIKVPYCNNMDIEGVIYIHKVVLIP